MSQSHFPQPMPFGKAGERGRWQGPALPDASGGYGVAANIQSPSDGELLDILHRALRGDPYPVSGRQAPAVVEEIAPISTRIRDILAPGAQPGDKVWDLPPAPAFAIPPENEPGHPDRGPGAGLHADAFDMIEALPESVPEEPVGRRWKFGLPSVAFVLAAAVAGALIPAMLAHPPRFVAQATLQAQGEAASRQAVLDALEKRIGSSHLLSPVVAKLKLDRDPEFIDGGSGPVGVALDIVSRSGSASDAPSRAQAALREAVSLFADRRTGALQLSVATSDAAKSARIANFLADAAMYDAAATEGADTSGQSRPALAALRKTYDRAAAAVAAFRQQVGSEKVQSAIERRQRRQSLDNQLKAADEAVQSARIRLAAAKTTRLGDVLDGSLSPDMPASAGLEDLRDRYSGARTLLSQLSVQLGPRHPRYLAQQAVVDGLRASLQSELQRLVASCDGDLKAALNEQKSLSDSIAALAGEPAGIDMQRFEQLQQDAETAQRQYEAALEQTAVPKSTPAAAPLVMTIPAVPPMAPVEPDLATAETTGFLIGLGIALCILVLRAWIVRPAARQPSLPVYRIPPASDISLERTLAAEIRPLMEQPAQRFDPAMAVANDRASARASFTSEDRPAGEEWQAVRRELASLRTKVETYAQNRNYGRH